MSPVASSTIIKSFITDHVSGVKRISASMIELMELFLQFKKRHPKIEADDEVYIPSAMMQSLVRKYLPFRDACFVMKGYHNRLEGKCDRIIGYTSQFNDLFTALLKNQYLLSLPLPLSLVFKELGKENHNNELIGDIFPGADVSNYHQTDKSPRYYIWLQNISRENKRDIYNGCIDFDIAACHPTIFWKEVLKGHSTNPYMTTMIEEPEIFLQHLIDNKIHNRLYPHITVEDERAAAKNCRSRLFNLRPDGHHRKSGVVWYDNLQDFIINEMSSMGIDDPHKFFCRHERKIVEVAIDVIGKDHVALLMHDGMICKDIENVNWQLSRLHLSTGYVWKAKAL